jgi:ABC-type antimicrobial peptide transport system permease subunit
MKFSVLFKCLVARFYAGIDGFTSGFISAVIATVIAGTLYKYLVVDQTGTGELFDTTNTNLTTNPMYTTNSIIVPIIGVVVMIVLLVMWIVMIKHATKMSGGK